MPRRRLALPPVLILLALIPLAYSQYKFDGIEVNFSDRGVFSISYGGFTMGTGLFKTWGPNWDWVDACSIQSSWTLLRGATATETTVSTDCYSSCYFARIGWSVRGWAGLNAIVVEINATADADSNFAGVAWDLEVPVAFFRGKTVKALLSNRSEVEALLREEHIPGNWTVYYFTNGIGWIVPFDEERGVLVATFGDVWPSGMDLEVQDQREWGGSTYALRSWLFYNFQMTKGQLLRLLVYVHPYQSGEDLEQARSKAFSIIDRLAMGESLSDIKAELINELNLEEAATVRRAASPPIMLIAFMAFITVIGVAILYILLKGRRQG